MNENLGRYRELIEVFNARDRDAFIARTRDDCEYIALMAGLEGGTYRGHTGLREWFADVDSSVRDVEIEILSADETLDGRGVLADGHGRAIGRASGAPVEWDFAQAVVFEDGLVVWAISSPTREEAVEALHEYREER